MKIVLGSLRTRGYARAGTPYWKPLRFPRCLNACRQKARLWFQKGFLPGISGKSRENH